MRITYDDRADAVYIYFSAAKVVDSIDLEDGVSADLDADGHVVGIEVLDARQRLGDDPLDVLLERLPHPVQQR